MKPWLVDLVWLVLEVVVKIVDRRKKSRNKYMGPSPADDEA